MSADKKTWTKKKIFQFAALFLFLVVLPGGSWLYLNSGLDYRLKALGELEDHGQIPSFTMTNYDGEPFTAGDAQGKVSVSAFLSLENEQLREAYGEVMRKLHLQFDDRSDFLMLTFALDTTPASAAAFSKYAAEYGLMDRNQCFFLIGGKPGVQELVRAGFQVPLEPGQSPENNPYLILADTSLTIRRYYDLQNEEEVKRLVEHVALILPRQKERDLVFKRETEK